MAFAMEPTIGVKRSFFIDRLWMQQHVTKFSDGAKSLKFNGVQHFELRVNSELKGTSKKIGSTHGPIGLGFWSLPRRAMLPKRGDRCRTISIDKADVPLVGEPSTLAESGASFAKQKVARLMEEIAYYQIVIPRKVERMKDIVKRELTDKEDPLPMKVHKFQEVFWRFVRPHTVRGTLIGATAVVFRALIENTELVKLALLPKAFYGMLALLCGNGYIIGINQIYDVQSDRISKPFLPIAAGDLSIPVAWALVTAFAALGVGLAATNFGPAITGLYAMGLFLGGIYSSPPLQLKRFPVPAFLIIATVRGFLLNFGVYYATVDALGLPFKLSPAIIFITGFVTVFAIVISITKDLADVEGDQRFGQETFASRFGVRNTSLLGAGLLLASYVGAIAATMYVPGAFNQNVMFAAHACLAMALFYQTRLLQSAEYSGKAIAAFYRSIWNLFYTQYVLLPFI